MRPRAADRNMQILKRGASSFFTRVFSVLMFLFGASEDETCSFSGSLLHDRAREAFWCFRGAKRGISPHAAVSVVTGFTRTHTAPPCVRDDDFTSCRRGDEISAVSRSANVSFLCCKNNQHSCHAVLHHTHTHTFILIHTHTITLPRILH